MLDNADENVFFPGLRAWVGYSQTPVPLDRDARGDGRSRVGIRGLVRLAIGALFGYSRLPLHLMVLISAASLVLSAIATIAMVILKATGQVAVEGIPLIVVLILFSLSVLGVFLTILAYMVSRNPAPTQVRSLFVIADESCLN
jgi:dolichol-phosphate mannosyltransferase